MHLKRRHQVMALLSVLATILYLDRVCVSFALPAIQADLHIGPEQVGWISLAFSLSYAVFEIPGGHMGDRYGSRSALMRITLLWSIFTALTGAAFGFGSLIAIRFMFGAGEAGAWPNASSVVSKWFPSASRAKAMGLFGAATQIGGGLAPLIVIPLQEAFGWRASFVVFGAVGVVWAVVWYRWFRDSQQEMGVPADELAELDEVRPAHAKHGMKWSMAVKSSTIWGLFAMSFANIYCAFFVVFWLPSFLEKGRHFTQPEVKWTALVWVVGGLANLVGGAWSDRYAKRFGRKAGRRIIGIGGMIVVSVCLVVVATSMDKVVVMSALVVASLAWGTIQSNAFATCIDVGGRHAGTVAGAMNTGGQLGGGVSALSFGYLVKATDWSVPVLLMAAVSALGALAWLWIDAAKPVVPPELDQ